MTAKKEQIWELLNNAHKEIRPLTEDAKNDFHKFSFRSYKLFFNHLQPLLAKHNIDMSCKVMSIQRYEEAKGSVVIVHNRYRFTAPDGSYVESDAIGAGHDNSDKTASKAMTAACKYALMQKFIVPFADVKDPDSESLGDSNEDRSKGPGKKPAKKYAERPVNKFAAK